MIDTGHWQISTTPIDTLPYGFVYLITNTITHKKYIGKKQIYTIAKRPPLKGKKRKRHFQKETNWKDYTSSSKEVNSDIVKYGKSSFKFEIIRWCCSKSELAYEEIKKQIEQDVLLKEDYYNGIINCRLSKIKLS